MCNKAVTTDGVECQRCMQWEHKVYSKITDDEYKILVGSSINVMFFCSFCCHKVSAVLNSYEYNNQVDAKLEAMQSSLFKSVEEISKKQTKQFDNSISKHANEKRELIFLTDYH